MITKSSFITKWLIFPTIFTMTLSLTNITFACCCVQYFIDMSDNVRNIFKYLVHPY